MNDPTPHEKTRIRQLEDASAHWERKYANARQYNRNLEERIAALEARCRELEAALHGLVDCCHMPEPHLGENNENVLLCPCCAEVLHVAGTHSADCHVFAAEKVLCPLQYPTPLETKVKP